jgi:hypothetical protein
MSAFQFGQSVAQFIKQADDMYNKYQASGHAGTMSYADFLEANDDGPTTPQAPTMPEAPLDVTPKPQGPINPQAPAGTELDPWTGHYYPKAQPKPPAGPSTLQKFWAWGTSPIGGNKAPAAPKPPNPQWEAQRQNFEGSMF